MSTTIKRFARYIALPAVSAGIIAGAALGPAGAANAGTYSAPSASMSTSAPHHAGTRHHGPIAWLAVTFGAPRPVRVLDVGSSEGRPEADPSA